MGVWSLKSVECIPQVETHFLPGFCFILFCLFGHVEVPGPGMEPTPYATAVTWVAAVTMPDFSPTVSQGKSSICFVCLFVCLFVLSLRGHQPHSKGRLQATKPKNGAFQESRAKWPSWVFYISDCLIYSYGLPIFISLI